MKDLEIIDLETDDLELDESDSSESIKVTKKKEVKVDKINTDDAKEVSEDNNCGIKGDICTVLKYMAVSAVSIIFWEFMMSFIQGSFSISSLFFLLFVPAEALFLAALCGIGNKLSARITFPIIIFLPSIWYIAQIIYFKNFGSLFSVAMAGMGNDAMGNFGWAVADTIEGSIFALVFVLLPVLIAIFLGIKNILKLRSYRWWMHFAVVAASICLWFLAVLSTRAFGNERLSPYYLLTSSTATTDSTAHKLGVMTTGIVESGSYYFGFGSNSSDDFEIEELNMADVTNDESIVIEDLNGDIQEDTADDVNKTPWVNPDIDLSVIENSNENEIIKNIASYLERRGPSTTNEYTGMFEGYNLIYICAESFWSYGCNEEVTPTLYKMANNGIVLNNYYNSFYNTTTNGEFAFCTSLWPDVSRNSKNGTDVGSFAQSASKFMPQGLGDLFTAKNIPAYAFHNYYGKYYRRILSWPNLGYKCRFTGDNMWFTSNWPASDLELLEQTVDDYINDDQFHAYYMTFSGHGPYTSKNQMYNKNIGAVTQITGEEKYNPMARGYLAGELELDRAMEYLLKRLEEAGQLDNTVIVIVGDHYPYYLEEEARTSLVGEVMDEDFEIYHSNCIIYNAGMSEPLYIDDYCSNVDVAPTMLNLFNIPFDSRLMMGRDIFSSEAHKRGTLANMSFITDLVKYNYETGEATWTSEGNKLTDDEKAKYIDNQLKSIENEYNASCKIIENNFYLELYKTLGLLSGTELSEEEQREIRVRAEDENYNEEDEAKAAEKAAEEEAQKQLEATKENLRQQGYTEEQIEVMINTGTLPVQQVTDPNIVVDPALTDPTLANPIVTDPNAVDPVMVNPVTVNPGVENQAGENQTVVAPVP